MASKKTEKIVTNMINDLIGMNSETAIINRYGRKWTVKMITAEEYLRVLKSCSDLKDMPRYFGLALAVLKIVITEVDDIMLDEDDKDLLFNNLSPSIINTLFSEYETLREAKEQELISIDTKTKTILE